MHIDDDKVFNCLYIKSRTYCLVGLPSGSKPCCVSTVCFPKSTPSVLRQLHTVPAWSVLLEVTRGGYCYAVIN